MEEWTFALVEERLIEAADLWRRSPGGGTWPFASDGPWHLVKSELYGPDVDKDAPIRSLPLSRAEVAQRDEASAWLPWVPERDRRLVGIVVMAQARTGRRPEWRKLLPIMGLKLGADGLRKRYERSITLIVRRLDREHVRIAA